ncbi:MAG TPA: AraC family transcriptional regulator [Cytophagales bacterium]|nr:AraC family transcriptional regulator [Cytophagales bacterium]
MEEALTISTISQAHRLLGMSSPQHPLVSVTRPRDFRQVAAFQQRKVVVQLWQVELKGAGCGPLQYGRSTYDYQEGTLLFTAPGQVKRYDNAHEVEEEDTDGWALSFDPDLIRKSPLADKISQYSFFSYAVNEALHVSAQELATLEELLAKIEQEYSRPPDRHSQSLIISNIELLLDYCLRYYDRQFIARSNQNGDVMSKFEQVLQTYYDSGQVAERGVPTVTYSAQELSLSTSYLSDLLKKETGKTAQEHIHHFVLEKAKTSLLNSTDSISQVGYALGFDYPQRFSNFFKAKTGMSPKEYRNVN